MSMPLSFLLGVFVLVLDEMMDRRLPGSESVLRLVVSTCTIVLPYLVARLTARRVRRVVFSGGVPGAALRAALQLQWMAVPAAYAAMVFWGDLPTFVARLAPSSRFAQLALLLLPLLAMEISLRLAEGRALRWLEVAGTSAPSHLGLERLPMTFFVALPILAFAGAADLVTLDRGLEVFLTATALGTTLGMFAMVLAMCFVLPLLFRSLMPVTPKLPAHLADGLRRTAAALGFPPRALLAMRTRHRFVNAALIGPLPWPRYLVLTDGLLSLLDPDALRGVVAHEVGHARANHPGLLVVLIVGIPLLLYQPAIELQWFEGDDVWLLLGIAAAILVALRILAHRFELEADQLSAEALGGASYCVQALRRVGEMSPHGMQRASLRHPSEARRIQNLYACESDPAVRSRFWRRGRWLRRLVWVATAISAVAFAWSMISIWPLDRAIWLFENGRFQEARQRLQTLPGEVVERQRSVVEELQSDVDAALALDLPAGTWDQVRPRMVEAALEHARDVVVDRGDLTAAMPWLSLALEQPQPAAWLRVLHRYGKAVAAGDGPEAARVAAHLLQLPMPPPWREAVLRQLRRQ